jgi:Phosphotransferase enzyme family
VGWLYRNAMRATGVRALGDERGPVMSASLGPADSAWLPAVQRRLGPARVVGRSALAGGYVAAAVERIDLDVEGAPVPVVLKTAGPVEVAAMRALAVVAGVEPRPIAVGPDWLVLPFVDGKPLAEGDAVPDEVWTTLARVHAHWRGRRPRGIPVVDRPWWASLVDRTLVAVRGGLARTAAPEFAEAERALTAWRSDTAILGALAVLPRTLCHGDTHRGNVLGSTLIDWGNARVAPAGLDLATLRAQGATPPGWYPQPAPAEAAWADVQAHVQYLGFAADHLGPERVGEMIRSASRALGDLRG